MRLQPVPPTRGATVRTDGRKKAALAWTVINHQGGRKHGDVKHKNTTASLLTAGCSVASSGLVVVFDDRSRDMTETNR